MPEIDPSAVLTTHVRAFNEGDVDTLMAGFTDDAEWITGEYRVAGREALTTFFATAMEGLKPHLKLKNLITEAGQVACELTETLPAGDTFHIAGFYQLIDGRIATAKIYREGSAEVPSG